MDLWDDCEVISKISKNLELKRTMIRYPWAILFRALHRLLNYTLINTLKTMSVADFVLVNTRFFIRY